MPDDANFCSHCGNDLKKLAQRKFKQRLFLAIGAAFVIGAYLYLDFVGFPGNRSDLWRAKGLSEKAERFAGPKAVPQPMPPSEPTRPNLIIGTVSIQDIAGSTLLQRPALVVAGGWIALPKIFCIGGFKWDFKYGARSEWDVEEGVLQDEEPIGLWQIRDFNGPAGPGLYRFDGNQPLEWVALQTPDRPQVVEIGEIAEQGRWVRFPLPKNFSQPGVFMQADRVVGWTFGPPLTDGYLWKGEDSRNLIAEFRIDDFYRLTFGNSREEEFSLALGRAEYGDLERLRALANGFHVDAKLAAADTPEHLRKESIIKHMQSLIQALAKEEDPQQIADSFDSRILSAAADDSLTEAVIQATLAAYGFEAAIQLVEAVDDELQGAPGIDRSALAKAHINLYRQWLQSLMEDEDYDRAFQVFQAADPSVLQDPQIHLIGVKLALAGSDWLEAQRLLASREYPASLRETVINLENQIAELKSQEGRIVVRFTPGSRSVPVTALLNGTANQQFIIDTGATLTTIPTSAVESMGIELSIRNRQRSISTASGRIQAREVIIASLDVNGWVEHNVTALVVDIPAQPGVGLLGLNYLKRFRMNLNHKRGLLALDPR
jgi:clan AA aspartic protease (TIGR02281 family)